MKWFGWCGLAITVLLLAFGVAWSSDAAPAVRLEVDRHVVRSGQQLGVLASADGECAWSVAWKDQRVTGRGRTLSARFTAPHVERPTRIRVVARCFSFDQEPTSTPLPSPSARTGGSQRVRVGVPEARGATVVLTVLPARGAVLPPGGNGLPATGGPERWFVMLGLALLFSGLGVQVVVRARR